MRLALASLAAIAALCILAASAFAAVPKEISSFNGTANSGPGFTSIGWDAVNEATGDVYVIDLGANAVDRFNSKGEFVGKVTGFDFSGEFNAIAVDNSGGANEGHVYIAQEKGNVLWAFAPSAFTSGGSAASTAMLWSNSEGFADLCGVAVDPAGNVWIGDYKEGVQERSASTGGPQGSFVAVDHLDGVGNKASTAIAFDASSNLYVDWYHGPVYKYTAGEYNTSSGELSGLIQNEGGWNIAADTSSNDIYVAAPINAAMRVAAWDSSGVELFGGPFDTTGTEPRGVAVDGKAHLLYVTSLTGKDVEVFQLPVPQSYELKVTVTGRGSVSAGSGAISGCQESGGTCAGTYEEGAKVTLTATAAEGTTFSGWNGGGCSGTGTCEVTMSAATAVTATFAQNPPTAVTGAASGITQTGATVAGTVNPNGGSVSSCEIEYGTSTEYGSQVPCSPSPGAGTSAVAVSATLVALTAGTEYHYRVVASNSGGTTQGADMTFKTEAPPVEKPVEKPIEKPAEKPVEKPAEKPVAKKPLTRGQLLARAIKKCKKLPKHKRAACIKRAKKKYAPPRRHRKRK
jgi:sugar lactone lactonase YvrE